MECKVLQEEEPEALRRDLIETLWNVKQIMANFNVWNTNDLIETLWNVKKVFISPNQLCSSIYLIETLWNVKTCTTAGSRSRSWI